MEEKVELKPDKDGFLFEIVDDNYLINRLFGLLIVTVTIFFILGYFYNFDVMKLANYDHRGHSLVFLGIPWAVIETIRIYIYLKKKDYKKIKFYETFIVNNKGDKLKIDELIDLFFLRINIVNNKVVRVPAIIIYLGFIPIGIYVYSNFLLSIFLYGLSKGERTIFTDNLVLARYDNKGVGIPLKMLIKEDRDKVIWYIEKYLNQDIYSLDKKLMRTPEYRNWNLVTEERKQEILKEKFNK